MAMQRSNDSIAKLASALAKAQIELVNPKKALVGTIYPDAAGQAARAFNYASLASGLEIVRKTLGQHEIATLQTTAIDEASQIVKLTTVLAHSSGEWISSDWPVCAVAETASPQRMGMALTYARRNSLFALIGIAGEDDLDAPDLVAPAQPSSVSPERHKTRNGHLNGTAISSSGGASWTGRSNGIGRQSRMYNEPVKPKILSPEQSIDVRDRLVAELDHLHSADDAAHWARRSLPEKVRLIVADELAVEHAFRAKLAALEAGSNEHGDLPANGDSDRVSDAEPIEAEACGVASHSVGIDKSALALPEPRRLRDRQHIRYVVQQPCLICGRRPSDPHHLRFAQRSALGRKVSDEFTVPLCRGHHRELHRCGDETIWWNKIGIDPALPARKLWLDTHPLPTRPVERPQALGATGRRPPPQQAGQDTTEKLRTKPPINAGTDDVA
jgi:ERF superfamily protein